MALRVRGADGGIEYDEWVKEFMCGWHRKWPVFWEDERVNQERVIMGLRWTFYRLHPNMRPQDIEAAGSISTAIIWSIPLSCRPTPKPKPIYVRIPLVVLDGKNASADVMGHVIMRCIGDKQAAAASSGSISTK
ncbi:uncharacterized protein ARMOST_17750 [Armillaria ostoyae]|uniref:Uncharacterized protein n=1 Tax=Armillaria ostoyae TaxID=47428 RepID=A0A284RZW6_ARMOS|nr:uncharacterized protein ARMOST_17750 [Armillaria ostoyae]